jgi:ribonuclease R
VNVQVSRVDLDARKIDFRLVKDDELGRRLINPSSKSECEKRGEVTKLPVRPSGEFVENKQVSRLVENDVRSSTNSVRRKKVSNDPAGKSTKVKGLAGASFDKRR